METGLLDPETIIKRKRLLMENRIKREEGELMKQMIDRNEKGGWKEKTNKIKEELNITIDLGNMTRYTAKKEIKEKQQHTSRRRWNQTLEKRER